MLMQRPLNIKKACVRKKKVSNTKENKKAL
jgi:hypothetical protein